MNPVSLVNAYTTLLTLAAGIITASLWPVLVLAVALIFRSELTALLRRVQSFKAAGIEAQLSSLRGLVDESEVVNALRGWNQQRVTHEVQQGGSSEEESPAADEEGRRSGGGSTARPTVVPREARRRALLHLKRVRPAEVLDDVPALDGGGVDPLLALLKADQAATSALHAIGHAVAEVTHPHEDVSSALWGVGTLGDAGVLGPEWMRAWVELQAARNEAARRIVRLKPDEARSWIVSAHRLVHQARNSAMGAVSVWSILADQEPEGGGE